MALPLHFEDARPCIPEAHARDHRLSAACRWIVVGQQAEGGQRWSRHVHRADAPQLPHRTRSTRDLLAGAPDWWEPPVRKVRDAELFLGFVYGFDGSTWQRAEYDAEDGFGSVRLPALSDERTREMIQTTVQHRPGPGGCEPSHQSVDALIAADGEVDAVLVADIVPITSWDTQAGAAARVFRAA